METPMTPVLVSSSKASMIAVSVVLLVIGLVAGYFIGKGGSGSVASPTTTPTASPTVATDTSDWKTLVAQKSGYQLMYPPEWGQALIEDYYHSDYITDINSRFTILVHTVPTVDQIECGPNTSSIGSITIAGQVTDMCRPTDAQGKGVDYEATIARVFSTERVDVYTFSCMAPFETCGQVLSTFKFTK